MGIQYDTGHMVTQVSLLPFALDSSCALGAGVTTALISVLFFQVFQGNFDNDTHRKNVIEPLIYARFIRMLPWSWYGRITLRVELLGCTEEE